MRSYRDLPLRFHEQTPLHRNEASGVLSGLTRVRQFSQDDAHCFVMESQIADEVEQLLRLVRRVYGDFGLPYTVKLATRPEKFLGAVDDVGSRRSLAAAGVWTPPIRCTRSTKGTAHSTDRSWTSRSPMRSGASGSAPRFSSTTRCRSASI